MSLLTRWVLPIAFVAIGIAILFGLPFPAVPSASGVRMLLGLVVVLLGVHRFAASRSPGRSERRYGGGRSRPWEDGK